MQHTCHILTHPDRESKADQNTDTTKVQLHEPMSFIGVLYGNMGEGLLTGVDMTHGQLHRQSTDDRSQKLGTWNTLHSLQITQSVGECPFQVTDLDLV